MAVRRNPIKIKNMNKLFFVVALSAGLIGLTSADFPSKKNEHVLVDDYENVLGTSLEIKIAAVENGQAIKAEAAALNEIERLNKILSGYDRNSEFSRWMNAPKEPVKISPELFDVLSLFDDWHTKSGGALNASAETINRVWRNAAKENRIPSATEISAALTLVRERHYILDAANYSAQRTSDAQLMLNSFTKSYIMNKAANAALAISGVNGIVLNIGGDIVVRGKHTEEVDVSNPKADAENDPPISKLELQNKTIATSGNYRRGELIDGKWYSHIVDPRTGQPAGNVISASVITDNSVDAGALATALNVLSPEEGKRLVSTVPHAEFMLITADGKRIESDGWKKFEIPRLNSNANSRLATKSDKIWDPNYELAINLELATLEGMRVHRPFVAVWVVDANKKPVRQIALWYKKPRWLDEMSVWYATYYDAFSSGNSNLSSTTSATRAAGKYTLKWDGKDDKGNLVKQGAYTIYIEAAREHGSHQLMTQEIDVKKTQHVDIHGNLEVSSASLDYHKKTDGN